MQTNVLMWNEWKPGLETDDLTLGEVLSTMPASDASEVPEIVRRYENPASSQALPGAVDLARHDAIHVLLGRGLTVQDEAFVIGVTMGADRTLTDRCVRLFEYASVELYPKPWCFKKVDILAFRLGLGYAKTKIPGSDLHLVPLEQADYQQRKVRDLRQELGILESDLRSSNVQERLLLPQSRASRRLGRFFRLPDQSIQAPKGLDTVPPLAEAA